MKTTSNPLADLIQAVAFAADKHRNQRGKRHRDHGRRVTGLVWRAGDLCRIGALAANRFSKNLFQNWNIIKGLK